MRDKSLRRVSGKERGRRVYKKGVRGKTERGDRRERGERAQRG